MQTVVFRVDGELWKRFKATCIRQGESCSEVLKELIGEWMEKPTPFSAAML